MRPNAWLERLFPSPRWDEVVYWALDLETTGFSPDKDEILSVAALPVRAGVIRYGERFSSLVRPPDLEHLPTEGLRAHHILPAEIQDAPAFAAILPAIDRILRDGLLILHFASLDLGFLRVAYARAGRAWPHPRVVDTVDLLLELHHRRHRFEPHPPPATTALAAARAALGLPPHQGHDALGDALATAELFLVLRSRLNARTVRQLG